MKLDVLQHEGGYRRGSPAGGPVTSDPSTSSTTDASILEQRTKLWEKAWRGVT